MGLSAFLVRTQLSMKPVFLLKPQWVLQRPHSRGRGGGALLQTDIRMYPFAFSLAGLCAVEFRLHCPLGPASPESLSPGAGGHSPHTAPRRGARGARCAARGAPAAS